MSHHEAESRRPAWRHPTTLVILCVGGAFAAAMLGCAGGAFAQCDWILDVGQPGFNNTVNALEVLDSVLYAGGDFVGPHGTQILNCVARWTGTSWTSVGQGLAFTGPGNRVHALTTYNDGSGAHLYAGGSFTYDGPTHQGIAQLRGGSWNSLGSGVNGSVFALKAVSTDALTPPGLYVGGDITQAGGHAVPHLARWVGCCDAFWYSVTDLGGPNGYVLALTQWDQTPLGPSYLYAGGTFTRAETTAVNKVARWNGSPFLGSWTVMGEGVGQMGNEFVYAMVKFNGTPGGLPGGVYVGGAFTAAGGVSANHIARWNGSSWSVLGTGVNGVNGDIWALEIFDDGSGPALYAGGNFTVAGGQPANHVARWDGTSWSPLGAGTDGVVYSLKDFGSSLVVGGFFQHAGGTTPAHAVSHIARWGCAGAVDVDADLGAQAPGLRFASIAPNPARVNVHFALELPAAGSVRLRIYDVAGHLAAEPLRETRAAGTVALDWGLRGRSGALVPAGVYLAELRFGSHTATRRFVVTR